MSIIELTDEAIAEKVQQGDTAAFGVLMERYEAKMLRYARRFLFGYDDAEDVVQEVFIRAYVNINSFDTTRRFSPWIYRVAHNIFINTIKKKGREPISFFDPDTFLPHIVSKSRPDTVLYEQELRHVLTDNIKNLKPKYREPLVLYYDEGLDYKTIADVLHIPIATVGVRLARARALLKRGIDTSHLH
jgi:RNA polymerase sigma-70 factor (ECF subfamily)